MVAGPYFAHGTATAGDFLHFIARHPDAALTDKLALELIVQTNTEHRWRQRRQQRERAGQTFVKPAPQRIVRQPETGGHDDHVAVCRYWRQRVVQQWPFFFVIKQTRNIDRAKFRRVITQYVQFRKVDFCSFHVEVALAQRRCRKVRLEIQ